MKVLFLFAILGAACALQAPMQYEFDYRGVVGTTIPGIRPQVSGTGIKAHVVLQMKSGGHGIVQLSNVEVGSYHDDMKDPHLRKKLPIRYSPLSQYSQDIEQPFSVNFGSEMGSIMNVQQNEPEWITNIRKSIVQILYVEPLKSQLDESDSKSLADKLKNYPTTFSQAEETLFGRCDSQYTITPIKEEFKDLVISEEQKLKKDVQDVGQYYKMVRSIDFDHCHERVSLQFSVIGNMSEISHGQFKGIQSRSSIGTYLLSVANDTSKLRVERAVVEGALIVNPYGIETDKIQSITNQTLFLTSVQPIQNPLRLPNPNKEVKTWRYEVVSPYAPASHSKPWVNYQSKGDKYYPIPPTYTLLGMTPSDQLVQEWKETAYELIQQVAQTIPEIPSVPGRIPPMPKLEDNMGYVMTYKLFEASQLIRSLPVPQIEQLFQKIFHEEGKQGERMQALLVDVVAASGAAAPYKVLLEKMKGNTISDERKFSLFPPLTIHVNNPVIIGDLLEFVKSLDPDQHPFLTSAAHVNFANLIHRVCLEPHAFNYSIPNDLYGNSVCDTNLIVQEFIPYLQDKIQQSDKVWQRSIYIEALTKVGSPHVLPVLRPIIEGSFTRDARHRILAIKGLNRARMPYAYKKEVTELLKQTIENFEEEPIVRQAAFITLLSWKPSPSWWQLMARSTWREPSRQMAGFITMTMENLAKSTDPVLAKQSTYSRFALRLAKPITISTKYAYNRVYSSYDPKINMGTFASFDWLKNKREYLPTEIYTTQTQSFGGFSVNWGDFGISQANLRRLNPLTKFFRQRTVDEEYYQNGGAHSRKAREETDYVQSWLEEALNPKDESENVDVLFFVRGWENMYNTIPLNYDTIKNSLSPNWRENIRNGVNMNIIKYFNTAENEYFLPTEIGLPLIGQVSRPVLMVAETRVRFWVFLKIVPHFDFTVNSKSISKTLARLRVFVPWTQKQLEVGVCQTHEVNLPVNGDLQLNFLPTLNLTLGLQPYTDKEIPLLYAHNVPYTAMKSFVPTKNEEYKVVTLKENKIPSEKSMFETNPNVSGFKGYGKFYGDISSPLETGKPFQYMTDPNKLMTLLFSPTAKLWQTYFVLEPSQSKATNISFSIEGQYFWSDDDKLMSENLPEHLKDSLPQLSGHEEVSYDGQGIIGVETHSIGPDFFRRNALYFTYGKISQKDSPQGMNSYDTSVGFATNYCPYSKDSLVLFYRLRYVTPNITTMERFQETVERNPKETYTGEVFMGPNFREVKPIMNFKGLNEISQERRQVVVDELKSVRNYDIYDPAAYLPAQAIYDQGNFEIEYISEKQFPQHLLNITNHIEDTARGFVYPFISINRMSVRNPEKTLRLTYNKPLGHPGFTFFVQKPNENVIVSDVRIPYSFNSIVPLASLTPQHEQNPQDLNERSSKRNQHYMEPFERNFCNVSFLSDRVTTFDGVRYTYKPLFCYTTLLIYDSIKAPFKIEIRTNEQKSASLKFLFKDGTEVTSTNTELKVNGEIKPLKLYQTFVVKNKKQEELMFIFRETENMLDFDVKIHRQEYVSVSLFRNIVEVIPRYTTGMQGKLRGLCGDYDANKKYDMTGPRNCIYKDDELFKFAWTNKAGRLCNAQEVEKKWQEVFKYQKNCPKRPSLFEDVIKPQFYYVYPIVEMNHSAGRETGRVICVPDHPIRRCMTGNKMDKKETVERMSKCWIKGNEPEDMKNNERRGYMDHPIHQRSEFNLNAFYRRAVTCTPLKT